MVRTVRRPPHAPAVIHRALHRFVLLGQLHTLFGKVTSSGKGAAGAPVFLEPFDLESGAGLTTVRTARTDLQGRYTVVAPGRYRLLSSFDFNQPASEEIEMARAVGLAAFPRP